MNGPGGTTVIRRAPVFLVTWLALGLLLACCGPARFDALSAVEKLFKAWELRDEQTVRDLLAEDVRWEIGGETYVGQDRVITFMSFDAARGSHLELHKAEAMEDTVLFELVESNDFMSALGVPHIRTYGRIVFERGKAKVIDELRPAEGSDQLDEAWRAFWAWQLSKHPETLARLFAPDGSRILSPETGKMLVALAAEWRSATGRR
jgi:hypothetical protein